MKHHFNVGASSKRILFIEKALDACRPAFLLLIFPMILPSQFNGLFILRRFVLFWQNQLGGWSPPKNPLETRLICVSLSLGM